MSESLDLAAEIGLRVRNNRTLLKLSREKLAEDADISLSFLADIEHGRKNMTTVTLYGLCKALHVSADYLLFGREAVTADNISRAILDAKPEDRKYLESLLVATAEILTEKKP